MDAISVLNTEASIATPCSVKTYGNFLTPPWLFVFEVIFEEAKKEIIIIDNYADYTLLTIIKKLKANITIITKKDNLLT